MNNISITVIGLGYIGLPTAALLSSKKFNVIGVDVNPEVVETVNRGNIHIIEPGLGNIVSDSVNSGFLQASLNVSSSDVFLICVPTPFKQSESGAKEPDLSYVMRAAKTIAPIIKKGNLIILESTSPVGATEDLIKELEDNGAETDGVHICYCPERVLPGNIMHELVFNDRIIGGVNTESAIAGKKFYELFVKGEVSTTNARTAEMCKLVENSYRDVNIAFANEISIICNSEGIDPWELISLANKHPRVDILQPGVGVGGHCIAVDPWFIVSKSPENSKLIKMAREINNYKTDWVIKKIEQSFFEANNNCDGDLSIVCLGLAFKPNIDDLRESPALYVTKALTDKGYKLKAVEPNISSNKHIELITLDEIDFQKDLIVFLVKHKEFLDKNFLEKIKNKNYLDFCGVNI